MQLPCFDLISVTLQLLDFFLEVRLVLFFLIHIFGVIDLCHTLSSSMSQNLPTVESDCRPDRRSVLDAICSASEPGACLGMLQQQLGNLPFPRSDQRRQFLRSLS